MRFSASGAQYVNFLRVIIFCWNTCAFCDWLKNFLRLFVNQSEVSPQPIVLWSHEFSRVWLTVREFSSSHEWLFQIPAPFVISQKILTPLSRQIRSEAIANRDFLTCVFPHLAAVRVFLRVSIGYFVNLRCDWLNTTPFFINLIGQFLRGHYLTSTFREAVVN